MGLRTTEEAIRGGGALTGDWWSTSEYWAKGGSGNGCRVPVGDKMLGRLGVFWE